MLTFTPFTFRTLVICVCASGYSALIALSTSGSRLAKATEVIIPAATTEQQIHFVMMTPLRNAPSAGNMLGGNRKKDTSPPPRLGGFPRIYVTPPLARGSAKKNIIRTVTAAHPYLQIYVAPHVEGGILNRFTSKRAHVSQRLGGKKHA